MQYLLALLDHSLGPAIVDIRRSQECHTGVVMLVVVPVEEILGPPASILLAAEPFWVIRAVLQSLELGFGVLVIVGNVRPGVGFGHTQVCHQKCHRFGSHRAAAISMDGELSWLNALPGTSFGNQLFR